MPNLQMQISSGAWFVLGLKEFQGAGRRGRCIGERGDADCLYYHEARRAMVSLNGSKCFGRDRYLLERLWRRQLSGDKKLKKRRLFLQIGHRESVPFLRYFVVLYCNSLSYKRSSRCEQFAVHIKLDTCICLPRYCWTSRSTHFHV